MARGRRGNLSDVGQELNLIPYLDIMVNLVLFMLVTITSFLSFTMLTASIPQLGPPGGGAPPPSQKAQLLLMLRVNQNGFDLDPNVQGGKGIKRSRIAMKDGAYDFASLTAVAQTVKEQFKDETRVLIIAHPKIIYDDIIHTMDSIRETKEGLADLFPDVTLSIL